MTLDQYSPCPCGSGKKFKWCCLDIHTDIAKVFQLDEQGQHDSALHLMEEVTKKHASNPEVWGRQAQLLFQNERAEEAEQVLDKAFVINPNYAYGHYLKARFRLFEGEIAGGLMLLRKAADLYDPAAGDVLSQLYVEIFECEMKLNRPLAAHAAAVLARRFNPASEQLQKGIETVFGKDNPNLIEAAWRTYEFQPLSPAADADTKAAWEKTLKAAATGKLADAAKAFGEWCAGHPDLAAGWFNLGLAQAWLGANRAALEALDHYLTLESDDERSTQAAALMQVLRLGQGMEDEADYVEHSITIPLQDPQQFVGVLGELEKAGLLIGVRVNQEEGILTAMLLEAPPPALTPELQTKQSSKLGAYLVLMSNIVRLFNVNRDALHRVFQKLRESALALMAEPIETRGPAKFQDVLADALAFPLNALSEEDAIRRVREAFERYFEVVWLNQPLKSLANTPPVDAAGHPVLRKKLRGLVDCQRLKHNLGLSQAAPAAITTGGAPAAPTGGAAARDLGAMAAADLAALPIESLSPAELDQAFRVALRLDARELAGKFATAFVEQPPLAGATDRYVHFNHLVKLALAESDATAALEWVDDGEKDDCENNEGRRRNDYELLRGQVLAKRGDIAQAADVFDRLIARAPAELKFRVGATESLLSAKQGAKARAYAEAGIAEAVRQNNGDMEGHFHELLDAASRQGK
jgi:tetratricopeptide (TPR) repeat protein